MPKSTKLVENIKNPIEVSKRILETLEHDTILELYEIADFEDHTEFLSNIAKKFNFLIKVLYIY